MSSPPSSAVPSETKVAVLLGTLVALTIIGSSAVAVALPAVARDLSLDTSGTGWVLAVFSLAFSVTTAVFGRLADLRGLRTPLRLGSALLVLGSVLAAAAWSFPILILGRVVQGAGAGAVPVLAVGVVAARFPGAARGRALGALTAVVSLVSGSGPLIGGLIAELLGWRAVLAVPVLAALITEPVARIAPAEPSARGRLDWPGAVLVAAVATAVVLLLQAPATGLRPGAVALLALAAGVGAAAVARHVRRRPHGLLPRAVVTNRRFVLCAAAGLTLLAAYLAMLLALPLLLSRSQGWQPLQIGLALLPAAVIGAVASRVVGGVARGAGRYGVVVALGAGSAAGVLLAAAAPARPVLLVVGHVLVVAGFGGGQVALLDGIPSLVEASVRNVALGVFNLVFFTGGAVGSAAVGGLADVVGLPQALACVAVLPAAGAVAAWSARR